MHHNRDITVVRPSPADGIPLQEWLAYIAASNVLQLVPPRTGINPFTKQPTEFKAAPGSAYFDTPTGRCSVSYRSGVLTITDVGDDSLPVATAIASALGATIATDDRGTPGGA